MKDSVIAPISFKDIQPDRMVIWCGILSSIWYIAINAYVPTQYPGYNVLDYTVSELSAIGAPTRRLWVSLVVVYPILFAIFGFGLVKASINQRSLKSLGIIIIAYSTFNIYWPPMHMRGTTPTLTDALHITWAAVTVALMILMMIVGAWNIRGAFGVYTIASIILLMLFGILTSLNASNIPTNGPTPFIGLWERINIGVFMVWVVMLGMVLAKHRQSKN